MSLYLLFGPYPNDAAGWAAWCLRTAARMAGLVVVLLLALLLLVMRGPVIRSPP